MSCLSSSSEQPSIAQEPSQIAQWQTVPAKVYVQAGQRWGVLGTMGCCFAPLAASCLLQPQVGDLVLLTFDGRQAYILAVLERSGHTAQLQLPADTVVRSAGSVRVQAGGGLHLQAAQAVVLQGADVALQAEQCLLQARNVHLAGQSLHSYFAQRQEYSGQRQQVDGQSQLHAGQRVTRVAGHDDYAAASQRLVIERDWRVRARSAELRGAQRVVVDGQQVHLG